MGLVSREDQACVSEDYYNTWHKWSFSEVGVLFKWRLGHCNFNAYKHDCKRRLTIVNIYLIYNEDF